MKMSEYLNPQIDRFNATVKFAHWSKKHNRIVSIGYLSRRSKLPLGCLPLWGILQ